MRLSATPWAKRPRRGRPDARLAREAAVRALTPDRPVLRPSLLDTQVHHRLRVDAVNAARLVLGHVAVEPLAVDEQALGERAGECELAMLASLLPGRRIRPGLRARA